jgi:hypothetical protein
MGWLAGWVGGYPRCRLFGCVLRGPTNKAKKGGVPSRCAHCESSDGVDVDVDADVRGWRVEPNSNAGIDGHGGLGMGPTLRVHCDEGSTATATAAEAPLPLLPFAAAAAAAALAAAVATRRHDVKAQNDNDVDGDGQRRSRTDTPPNLRLRHRDMSPPPRGVACRTLKERGGAATKKRAPTGFVVGGPVPSPSSDGSTNCNPRGGGRSPVCVGLPHERVTTPESTFHVALWNRKYR